MAVCEARGSPSHPSAPTPTTKTTPGVGRVIRPGSRRGTERKSPTKPRQHAVNSLVLLPVRQRRRLCHHQIRRSDGIRWSGARQLAHHGAAAAENPERSRHCDRITPFEKLGGDPGARTFLPSRSHPSGRGQHQARAWTPARGERRPPAPMRTYPFTAIVGADDMALALALTTVSPEVGGVLVRGEKGTAKSTMVRALAALLPQVNVIDGCRFSCDPADPDPACPDGPHPIGAAAHRRPARLVELPVGATEDRVIGSLHLERALTAGVTEYEPGLLAAAHRGLLYVDEVNLLH